MKKWTEDDIIKAIEHRTPKQVTEYITYNDTVYGTLAFEICPACGEVLDRTYQNYCSECGQKLKWPRGKAGCLSIKETKEPTKAIELNEITISKESQFPHYITPTKSPSNLVVAEVKDE